MFSPSLLNAFHLSWIDRNVYFSMLFRSRNRKQEPFLRLLFSLLFLWSSILHVLFSHPPLLLLHHQYDRSLLSWSGKVVGLFLFSTPILSALPPIHLLSQFENTGTYKDRNNIVIITFLLSIFTLARSFLSFSHARIDAFMFSHLHLCILASPHILQVSEYSYRGCFNFSFLSMLRPQGVVFEIWI